MITHTGLKNHHCDICGKSFTRNRDMVAHKKKIHLNERNSENYKCPECRKVFANSSSLNIHFRTHEATITSLPPPPPPLPPSIPSHHHHTLIQSHSMPSVPSSATPIAAPTALGGTLGAPPSLSSSLGVSIGLTGHSSLSMLPPHHSQGLSVMHTQRLHPY